MFLGSVGLVTLALGAIGIINIMLVAVADRTREIGLRKAVGATNRSIMFQFFVEGAFLTLLSGGIGIGAAAGLMALLSNVSLGDGFDPPKLVASTAALAVISLASRGRGSRALSRAPGGHARTGGGAPQGIDMHSDLLKQAYSAMRHDLRRTLLTMAGMAWGIATVVLLLSYGNGFGKAIETIFESFGATAVGVFPGRTSQQAGGNKAGVQVRFTNDDIELLRNNLPLCRHVVRMAQKDSTVQNDNRSFTFPVMGLDPSIQAIWNLDIAEGRFLDDADNMQHGLYAVIASEARDKLFSGMPAVGQSIRIDGVTFEVIGVGAPRMQEGDNDNNRVVYIPYNSMDVLKDNHYLDGIWLDSAGLNHDRMDRDDPRHAGDGSRFQAR